MSVVDQAWVVTGRPRPLVAPYQALQLREERLREQWGPKQATPTTCPSATARSDASGHGLRQPDPCRKKTCLTCNRRWARIFSKVVALAKPMLLLLLTALPATWHGTRKRLARLRDGLLRDGGNLSLAWAVEPNPSGSGLHLHAWAYGDGLTPEDLRTRAETIDFGWSDARPVTYYGGMDYICKNATWNESSLAAHLAHNNNALVAMKGFARDGRTGESLTLRKAEVAARHTRHQDLHALYKPDAGLLARTPDPEPIPASKGAHTGIYAVQHCNVPRLDPPRVLALSGGR